MSEPLKISQYFNKVKMRAMMMMMMTPHKILVMLLVEDVVEGVGEVEEAVEEVEEAGEVEVKEVKEVKEAKEADKGIDLNVFKKKMAMGIAGVEAGAEINHNINTNMVNVFLRIQI